MVALRSLLAENRVFLRKMYNDIDSVALEFYSMRDTINQSFQSIMDDLMRYHWRKFGGDLKVSTLNTFMYGESNSLDICIYIGKYLFINSIYLN